MAARNTSVLVTADYGLARSVVDCYFWFPLFARWFSLYAGSLCFELSGVRLWDNSTGVAIWSIKEPRRSLFVCLHDLSHGSMACWQDGLGLIAAFLLT